MVTSRGTIGVVLMALLAPAGMGAQPTIADSYAQARRLLDRAITAHGGPAALQRARRARIEFVGEDIWRHQSRRPEPPYDRRPSAAALHLDLDAGRAILDATRSYPGDIPRAYRFVTGGDRAYYVNHRQRTYRVEDYPAATAQLNNLAYLPQLILQLANDSGTRLRSLGPMRLSNGATVDAITTTTADGSLTIGLNPENHLLQALISVRNDAIGGTVASETEYLEYRDVAGTLTPGRRTVSVDGVVTENFTYKAVVYGEPVDDALVSPPPGYELRTDEETPVVRTLAENVWLIGSSAASLVVAIGDDVVVVDAAPSTSSEVFSQIARLAPGKKVTYAIPTHHHDDHAPGIRSLSRAGATVLAAPGNKKLFETLIDRPVQTIDGRRVFSDGKRSLEIHNIGPSPHAEDMLVAWLPQDGILFEADLIDAGAPGTVEAGANNETTMHFARWLRERGWAVKQFASAHGAVIDSAAFERLVRSTW